MQREAAGFDFAEIKSVADQFKRWRESVRMCSTNLFCASFSGPLISSASKSEKPMIVCSGVRNSWLMLARNSLFRRFGAFHFAIANFQLAISFGKLAVNCGAER